MKIIELDQRSTSWLEWRNSGIGASEISIIMGSNPYSTPFVLWQKKCGYVLGDPVNPAMQHGIDHEDIALKWVNENKGLSLEPLCAQDDLKPHFKASLDGWDSSRKVVCEIKCPMSFKTLDMAKNTGYIHPYWIDQVQWQIMITDAKDAYIALWDFRDRSCLFLEVHRDEKRIALMREKADEFWKGVKIGIPPAASPKDFINVEDLSLKRLLYQYESLDKEIKALEGQKKALKSQIEDFGDDGNFTAYGFKIVRCPSRVTYDMEKMKSDGIDLGKYAKKSDSIGYYKIILPKGDK